MSRTVLNAAAVAAMILVLTGLGLTLWSGNQRNAAYGPSVIAQDSSKRIWLLADQKLFILGSDGRLEQSSHLSELGMDLSTNALATLPGGGAVVGARDTGLLYVLDANARVVRTVDPSTTSAGHLRSGFSLHSMGDRIVVAHTGHHRMLVLDEKGAVVHRAGSLDGRPGDFHFPNHITVGADGLVYVPDTNHHEIEVLNADLQRASDAIPVPRVDGASWPVFVAPLPSGSLAVTVLNHGMRKGVAAFIDRAGKLQKKLELQPGAEPLGLLVRESDVLVCDQYKGRFELRRFDHDGNYAGEFGDAAFRAFLSDAASRHRLYANLRIGGQVLAISAALILLLIYRKSRTAEVESRAKSLELPKEPVTGWRGHIGFHAAMGWPLGLVCLVFFGVEQLKLPPGLGVLAYSMLMAGLFWSIRRGFSNVQHPRFAPFIRSQTLRLVRTRLPTLSWWGSKEPVLGCATAFLKRQAVLVLVSPVRVVVIPMFGSSPCEAMPLKSITGITQVQASWYSRLVMGKGARGLTVQLMDPQSRTVELSFVFAAEFEAIVEAIRTARERWLKSVPGTALRPLETGQAPPRMAPHSILLSAVLPGLGHFNQRRNQEGLIYLSLFGVLATANALEWFVHLQRISEVSEWAMIASSAFLAALWLAALGDVWQHERQLRKLAAVQ